MDLMRSEAMHLVQVIIPAESAHLAVSYLGDLGLVQFKDVSPLAFNFGIYTLLYPMPVLPFWIPCRHYKFGEFDARCFVAGGILLPLT
jgi:hypothetical protein